MSKKKRRKVILILACILAVLLVGIILTDNPDGKSETIQEVMRDGVLHETEKVRFLGLIDVNPAFISAVVLTCVILGAAALIRVFVIPKFTLVPGKFQLLLEEWVGLFENLAKTNSPYRNRFLGGYIFCAGSYIFLSTIFELFGIQAVTTAGESISLPAPLADINADIALGFLSYGVIMSGGIAGNGIRGVGKTLKDFSLPISMSFRLFGALLSGLLVTDLVYYSIKLSFVLPVFVGIMFTLLHALIQTYVLVMLTSYFYGEVTAPTGKPHARKTKKAGKAAQPAA
ncbi:MAG: F0F1 ATP synthase subunit A [Lachnospiraceae bacterium]